MTDSWSTEKVTELIDLYEQHPCLYQTNHKDYFNRDERSKALAEIAQALEVSVKDVEKKLKSIRTQYNREKAKTGKKKTGQGLDEVYVSKWAHFGQLQFLDEYLTPRSSVSNLSEEQNIASDTNPSEITSDVNSDEMADQIQSTKQPTSGRGKKRKKTEQLKEDFVLQKALDCLENNEKRSLQRDADEVFGEYVTTELKAITDERTKRFIKFKIQSLLFESLCTPSPPVPILNPEPYPYGAHPLQMSRSSTPSSSRTPPPNPYIGQFNSFQDN